MGKQPPRDIRQRTFEFACAIVTFCRALGVAPGAQRHIAGQLLNAGTSVGANVEEAKAAYSRRDFIAKNSIALKEARESLYWLRIIKTCALTTPESVAPLLDEASQLVAILTATVKTARLKLTALAILLTSSFLLLSLLIVTSCRA
jgi:four helix bundle protein